MLKSLNPFTGSRPGGGSVIASTSNQSSRCSNLGSRNSVTSFRVATAADLIAQADSAAAAGDLKRAEGLLDEAARIQADDAGLFLKLAAIQRGTGQPDRALESVHRALAVDPRDFTALLMRASLLDRLEMEEAPEAWAHAIAQKPPGELPSALAKVVSQGEQRVAAWQQQRDEKLRKAM